MDYGHPFGAQVPDNRINLVRILGIASLVIILGISVAMGTIAKSPSNLEAEVKWDGTNFHIINNNDFQWDEVNLVLNSDYKLKLGIIVEHSEVVAAHSQFVKDDGTAFDISTMNPEGFYIFAQIPNNQTGSWFFKFP